MPNVRGWRQPGADTALAMTSDSPQRQMDPDPETVDKSVRSETVPTEQGDVTVAQQPTGDRNMVGGGEFPDPETTPTLHDPEARPDEDGPEVIASGEHHPTGRPARRPAAED